MPEYDYVYPNDLDLRPTSKLHEKLVTEIMGRAVYSSSVMSARYDSWRKIDHNLTAYVPLSEEERITKANDPRKPVSIVVPMSFVVLDTIITYLSKAFLEDIFFPCEGIGPEDTIGAIKLQHVLQQQAIRGKLELALHTQWRDMLAYGMGFVVPVWTVRTGPVKPTVANALDELLASIEGFQPNILWEGHEFENIDPYCVLPDVNCPINKLHKMEYFGWFSTTNEMDLLKAEHAGGEGYFNCKYLKDYRGKSKLNLNQHGRGDKYGMYTDYDNKYTTTVDVITMMVKLIPSEWELGDSDLPEIWNFELANDRVIIKASKLDYDHQCFPVCVAAPDFDGYSVSPQGRLEIIYNLQEYADWLLSSHIVNTRKCINNMLVVDPNRINIDDLMTPTAGKIIRTTYSSWTAGGLDGAIKQLEVTDVTRNHMNDLQIVMDLIQRASAAVDSLQGFMRPTGERRTATETRDTRMSALSRLARIARVCSVMGMRNLGELMASQTQQYMSQPTWVKLIGSWDQVLMREYGDQLQITDRRLYVEPRDLQIGYDVAVKDSFLGGSEYGDLWIQLMQIVGSMPPLAQRVDLVRMFLHAARLLGARNIQDFVQQAQVVPPIDNVQVAPDQMIQEELAKGNMMPYGQQEPPNAYSPTMAGV